MPFREWQIILFSCLLSSLLIHNIFLELLIYSVGFSLSWDTKLLTVLVVWQGRNSRPVSHSGPWAFQSADFTSDSFSSSVYPLLEYGRIVPSFFPCSPIWPHSWICSVLFSLFLMLFTNYLLYVLEFLKVLFSSWLIVM